MIINFSDLLEYDIETGETMMSENNGPFNLIYYEMELWNCTIYFRMKSGPAYQLANDLFFIQQKLRKDHFSKQLALFNPIAGKYRSLKEKPAISEELRKFIVQANAFNQKQQYSDAINAYNNAVKSDPVSYPAAYSNLALLSAQISKYDAAIFYMKEYLLLVPDATDARSAQDKIYEWESMIKE
jgi:tetratricopeptide (TPR) repeat protein